MQSDLFPSIEKNMNYTFNSGDYFHKVINPAERVMALSWKQPFATAMLFDKIETRTWPVKYRGWVLICTSKAAYDQETVKRITGEELFIKMCVAMNKDSGTLDLDGYAIAIGRLVDCRKMRLCDEEKSFVKFRNDLYCHVYASVYQIKPFSWKGSQGFRELNQDQIKQIQII